MKIITFSDLHLEFGVEFLLPSAGDADLMILAGDTIVFRDLLPLDKLLAGWNKPVIYIAGNHEFYTRTPMWEETEKFKNWLAQYHPKVIFLQDEAVSLNGVHFFGGTMWTDFSGGNAMAMLDARWQMQDYQQIMEEDNYVLTPEYTVKLHEVFVRKLVAWFGEVLTGPRVVITHHAPVINPKTKHHKSPLVPAFNSLDMMEILKTYQPALWIYGHTHECDDHWFGNTRIISNQRGYPWGQGDFESKGFDPEGIPQYLGNDIANLL